MFSGIYSEYMLRILVVQFTSPRQTVAIVAAQTHDYCIMAYNQHQETSNLLPLQKMACQVLVKPAYSALTL
jgi:hypothetical protein